MFENPRRGRQARNFTTNVPKILDLKSSSEQIFSRKLPLGTPDSHTEMQLIPLEKIHSSRDSVRKARESHLIDKATTLEPHGLNRRDELL